MYSRLAEESTHEAAHEQAELLREEGECDLLQAGARLAAQVEHGGAEQGQAQAEAEEGAPVGEGGLPVAAEQRAAAGSHHTPHHVTVPVQVHLSAVRALSYSSA